MGESLPAMPSSAPRRARPRRWAVALTCALVVLASAGVVALRSYRSEAAIFRPSRHAVASAGPLLAGSAHVTFRTPRGTRIVGWYVPSQRGAAIVLTHGSGADRTQMLDEARVLSERGFGVLLFDWPGHGESEGAIHWDAEERAALTSALDWLGHRPDAAPERLGALGFSMGGFIVAQVAASDTRIRAAALLGTPPSAREQTSWEYRKYGPLSQLPALWADRVGGLSLVHGPKQRVAQIAPRPVLIITGSADPIVSPSLARSLFSAARAPKQLLEVPGAGHGGYLAAGGITYARALGDFFARALEREEAP